MRRTSCGVRYREVSPFEMRSKKAPNDISVFWPCPKPVLSASLKLHLNCTIALHAVTKTHLSCSILLS